MEDAESTSDESTADEMARYLFAVILEVKERRNPALLHNLSFARLIDDIIVPYEMGDAFFVDGVPVKAPQVERIKIIRQAPSFEGDFDNLHHYMRHGDMNRQKIYAAQYETRLDAVFRAGGEDVTSQVIKAFDRTIKPTIKDYLPKREELIAGAFRLFVTSVAALASSSDKAT